MKERSKFFDWRWEDEPMDNPYQLVINRRRKYGEVQYQEGRFIWPDGYGDLYHEEDKYFLKQAFIDWYNYADVTDIEPFLESQYLNIHSDSNSFLRYIRSILKAMPHLNEWELNFEGKRQVGLDWVIEKLEEEKSDKSLGRVKDDKQTTLTFNNLFILKFISGERLLQSLRGKYLDDQLNWIREKHDLKGLVHFLVDSGWVRTDKYATVQKILLSRIKLNSAPPSRPAEPPKSGSVEQYQFLKKNS
jgi:hypothetical protein